jgi:hypothetical protein
MTNENSSYTHFFPVNFTESQTENRAVFGRKKWRKKQGVQPFTVLDIEGNKVFSINTGFIVIEWY